MSEEDSTKSEDPVTISEEDEPVSLSTFSKDIISLIFKELTYSNIVNLYSTEKKFIRWLLEYQKRFKHKLSKKVKLQTQQLALRHNFLTSEECFSFIPDNENQKVFTGYLCRDKYTLILCTPSSINTWMNRSKELDWYNSNPKHTKILFLSSKAKKHNDYLNKFRMRRLKKKRMTIVATHNSYSVALDIFIYMNVHVTLIVDNAHFATSSVIQLQNLFKWNSHTDQYLFNRTLLLSCYTVFNPLGFRREDVHRKISMPKDKISVQVVRDSPIEEDETTIQTIMNIIRLANTRRKTIIVYESFMNSLFNGVARDILLHPPYKELKIFSRASNDEIFAYNRHEGSACFVLSPSDIGKFNLYADILIMVNPLSIGIDNCRIIKKQIAISLIPNKILNIEIMGRFLDCAYVKYFSSGKWPWNIEPNPSQERLITSNMVVESLGGHSSTISVIDGCIIFHNYDSISIDSNALIDWWMKHKTPGTILKECLIRHISELTKPMVLTSNPTDIKISRWNKT